MLSAGHLRDRVFRSQSAACNASLISGPTHTHGQGSISLGMMTACKRRYRLLSLMVLV